MDFIALLINEHQKSNIEMHLYFNGVDYDKDFYYNPHTRVLNASSSTCSDTFGTGEKDLLFYLNQNMITLKIIIKNQRGMLGLLNPNL